MARLNISVDDKYFKSDSISHGRLIRVFFENLAKNVFNQSYHFWKAQKDLLGVNEIPLLYSERNLYSTFAVAINEITPVHLSEWAFNKSDEATEKSRRVDFWCLNKNSETGRCLNYFIEIKKTWYCVSEGTDESFTSGAKSTIDELVNQLSEIKKLKPDWEGDGNVFLGVVVIPGYYSSKKESGFDESIIREEIQHNLLDKRIKSQMIISTWILPGEMETQWETKKYKFISIVGIAITKTKNG